MIGTAAPSPNAVPINTAPCMGTAVALVDLDPELAAHHRAQEHLGMAGHDRGDPCGVLVTEPLLGEHVRHLGLRFAGPLLDLRPLAGDLGVEDLALALRAEYTFRSKSWFRRR